MKTAIYGIYSANMLEALYENEDKLWHLIFTQYSVNAGI